MKTTRFATLSLLLLMALFLTSCMSAKQSAEQIVVSTVTSIEEVDPTQVEEQQANQTEDPKSEEESNTLITTPATADIVKTTQTIADFEGLYVDEATLGKNPAELVMILTEEDLLFGDQQSSEYFMDAVVDTSIEGNVLTVQTTDVDWETGEPIPGTEFTTYMEWITDEQGRQKLIVNDSLTFVKVDKATFENNGYLLPDFVQSFFE